MVYVYRGIQPIKETRTMNEAKDFCVEYMKTHPKGKLNIPTANQPFGEYTYLIYRDGQNVVIENKNGGGEIIVLKKSVKMKPKAKTNDAGIPVKALKF